MSVVAVRRRYVVFLRQIERVGKLYDAQMSSNLDRCLVFDDRGGLDREYDVFKSG